MIILAGVAINLTLGENGLFRKTKFAEQKYEYSSAKEILELKLTDIHAECLANRIQYNIKEVSKKLELSSETTIDIMYYYGIAKVNLESNYENKPSKLSGIAVIVNQYPKYKFLISEKLDDNVEIKGVVVATNEVQYENDFIDVEVFERENLGIIIEAPGNIQNPNNPVVPEIETVDVSVLENKEEFVSTIQNDKKLQYIIDNSDTFMNEIFESQELMGELFNNESAIDKIIENDTWRNTILSSSSNKSGKDSSIIVSLDNSNPIVLPKTDEDLYSEGKLSDKILYSSWLRNDSIHSPENAFKGATAGKNDWETEYPGLPAYIGFDYGEGNEVWIYKTYIKPGNNTYPIQMKLQCSDDNKTWTDIYTYTIYPQVEEEATEVINSESNNAKHRYWRLYIEESKSGGYVDLLKIDFYAK